MLKTRILTALVLLPVMLSALFLFSDAGWAAFSWLIVLLAMWEFARMSGASRLANGVYLALATAVAAAWWRHGAAAPLAVHVLGLVFWLLVAPLWLARRWALRDGWVARALGWIMLFPAWFALLEWRGDGAAAQGSRLLAVMGLVWVADIAAYFAGKAFGRRKLAPAISPGKSWEGVAGAVVAVAVYAVLVSRLGWLDLALPGWVLLLLALPLTAVSIVGDLLESWFKRSAGIKDSSGLLPGHGGVYDRIDSLIAVLAVSNALRVLSGL
jgi:phosphatidate cytidylyltransferase